MICVTELKDVMSKSAFKRKRAPIEGRFGSVTEEAKWRAGHRYSRVVRGAVKRSACLISPSRISSYRARPGMIGKPAASAEVHVCGLRTVSYTHLRAHETPEHLVC